MNRLRIAPSRGTMLCATLALSLWASAFSLHAPLATPQTTGDGGLVTLFAADDLACSINLRTGEYGGRIVDGEVALDRAQLLYDVFAAEMLSFGFAHDEVVNVIDLGPLMVPDQTLANDVSLKFPISVFHTLTVEGKRLVYQDAGGAFVRLREGGDIFKVAPRGLRHLEPTVGNTYVVRFERLRGEDRGDRMAKFQVVEHRPGESLTLRWQSLGKL